MSARHVDNFKHITQAETVQQKKQSTYVFCTEGEKIGKAQRSKLAQGAVLQEGIRIEDRRVGWGNSGEFC